MEFGGNVMEAGLVGKEVRQVLKNDLYFSCSLLLFTMIIDVSKINTMKIRIYKE